MSQIIVLAILILINAFFAATEIAFISLNDAKIEKQAKEGNKKAKQIRKSLRKNTTRNGQKFYGRHQTVTIYLDIFKESISTPPIPIWPVQTVHTSRL